MRSRARAKADQRHLVAAILVTAACVSGSEDRRGEAGAGEPAVVEALADARSYQRRGEQHFMMGRVRESVADFDRVVALEPERGPYHWQRGISYYYVGEYGKGRAQFERHRSVNPDDVENAAWHFFCVARSEGVAAAREALIPVDLAKDPRVPMSEIYRLLAGEGSEEAILASAEKAPEARRRQALQYAHLYLGLWHEVNADRVRSIAHIRRSADEYRMEHYMGWVARTHLMLRGKSGSPRGGDGGL